MYMYNTCVCPLPLAGPRRSERGDPSYPPRRKPRLTKYIPGLLRFVRAFQIKTIGQG